MTKKLIKDPEAELDYGVDWEDWLDGDTISTSSWSVDPSGELAIMSDPIPSKTDTTAVCWVEGGEIGNTYRLINEIVTAAGRTDDRTLIIEVRPK